MLSLFNRRNIHNFFAITKESGLRVSLSNMKRVLSNSASDINRVNVLTEIQTNGTSTRPIIVPSFQEPLVSVIIPVHNQFMFTYRCIESVVSTSEGIPYEIILADDCSTDETQKIEDYIEGRFAATAGAIRCREIKAGGFPCVRCVETAAALAEAATK